MSVANLLNCIDTSSCIVIKQLSYSVYANDILTIDITINKIVCRQHLPNQFVSALPPPLRLPNCYDITIFYPVITLLSKNKQTYSKAITDYWQRRICKTGGTRSALDWHVNAPNKRILYVLEGDR